MAPRRWSAAAQRWSKSWFRVSLDMVVSLRSGVPDGSSKPELVEPGAGVLLRQLSVFVCVACPRGQHTFLCDFQDGTRQVSAVRVIQSYYGNILLHLLFRLEG